MKKRATTLVTGAAGFIGANLVRRLLRTKTDVHILIKTDSNLWRLADCIRNVTIHPIELTDKEKVKRVIQKIKPQVIFHLAAHGSYPMQTDIDTMIQTNIIGTTYLLMALQNINYRAFINTGSSSEYGFKDKPMAETDVLEPTFFYAATKGSATLLCQTFAKVYQKPIITLRPFSVYGPWEEPRRFIPTAMVACIRGNQLPLTSGSVRRDFIYIDDMIDAYMVAAKKAVRLSGEIFNIGTGIQSTNDEVVSYLERIANKKISTGKGAYPKRSWDRSLWLANGNKARRLLDWTLKYSLRVGLEKTLGWFKNHIQFY